MAFSDFEKWLFKIYYFVVISKNAKKKTIWGASPRARYNTFI